MIDISHNLLLIVFADHNTEGYIGRNVARYWSVVTTIDRILKILFPSSGHRYRPQDDYICPSIRLSFVFALTSINVRPQIFFDTVKILGDIVQFCFCPIFFIFLPKNTTIQILYIGFYTTICFGCLFQPSSVRILFH